MESRLYQNKSPVMQCQNNQVQSMKIGLLNEYECSLWSISGIFLIRHASDAYCMHEMHGNNNTLWPICLPERIKYSPPIMYVHYGNYHKTADARLYFCVGWKIAVSFSKNLFSGQTEYILSSEVYWVLILWKLSQATANVNFPWIIQTNLKRSELHSLAEKSPRKKSMRLNPRSVTCN